MERKISAACQAYIELLEQAECLSRQSRKDIASKKEKGEIKQFAAPYICSNDKACLECWQTINSSQIRAKNLLNSYSAIESISPQKAFKQSAFTKKVSAKKVSPKNVAIYSAATKSASTQNIFQQSSYPKSTFKKKAVTDKEAIIQNDSLQIGETSLQIGETSLPIAETSHQIAEAPIPIVETSLPIKVSDNNSFLIIARRQTQGRGRYGRNFFSPLGGLYFSFVLPVSDNLALSLYTPLLAVAVRQSLELVTGRTCLIKWVNDLYYANKKVAGIISECVRNKEGKQLGIVCGIGINWTCPTGNSSVNQSSINYSNANQSGDNNSSVNNNTTPLNTTPLNTTPLNTTPLNTTTFNTISFSTTNESSCHVDKSNNDSVDTNASFNTLPQELKNKVGNLNIDDADALLENAYLSKKQTRFLQTFFAQMTELTQDYINGTANFMTIYEDNLYLKNQQIVLSNGIKGKLLGVDHNDGSLIVEKSPKEHLKINSGEFRLLIDQ